MNDGEYKSNMEYCSKCFLHPVHSCKRDKEESQVQEHSPERTHITPEQYGASGQDYKDTIRISSKSGAHRDHKEPETFTRHSRPKDRIIFVNGISDMFGREDDKKEYTFNFNFN